MGSSGGWRFDRTQKGRHARLGWTWIHVAVDDHSRLAFVEELPDEGPETTVGFLQRALAFYGTYGITVRRVMTDNGNPTGLTPSGVLSSSPRSGTCGHVRTRPGPTGRPRPWSRSC